MANEGHPADKRWESVLEQDGVALVRNLRAMPRAWLVGEVREVDGKEALRTIRGEMREPFEPASVALIEGDARLPPMQPVSASDSAITRSSSNGHIVIDTKNDGPAFLVVSESYFPGWEATIDAAPTRVFRTDYILLGVAVPAGSHRVELRYGAPAAKLGGLISLLTAALLLGLGMYAWRRRARTTPRNLSLTPPPPPDKTPRTA